MGFILCSNLNIFEMVTKSTMLSRILKAHLGLMGKGVIIDF